MGLFRSTRSLVAHNLLSMTIGTQPARGTRDILPQEAARRHRAISAIVDTYQRFGFQLIETPSIERIELLTGGEGGDNEKQLFKVQKRGEDLERAATAGESLVDLGLRFDLTVPLTRYFGEHQAVLPRPFKAIQIGPVWRAERPQKGRYRQFVQCDIDILGDPTIGAEVDLIEASTTVFAQLGIAVDVRLNDRRLLSSIGLRSGIEPDRVDEAMIILDKVDKIGVDGVHSELTTSFDSVIADLMMQMIASMASADKVSLPWSDPTDSETDAVLQLNTIIGALGDRVALRFDPTLVRGMGYYTGTIIEFGVSDLAYSVGGGGRYDKLIGKWSGMDVPACGVSIGFERIIEMIADGSIVAPVAVLFESDDDVAQVLAAVRQLRQSGTDVAMISRAGKLGKQLTSLAGQNYAAYAIYRSGEPLVINEFQERAASPS